MHSLEGDVKPLDNVKEPLPRRNPGKSGYPIDGERQPVPQV
ncbi:hypothetical protein ABT282_07260 [Streptomyces sp. NPDC000927]